MSDKLMGSAYVRIEGEQSQKALAVQRKGKSDKSPIMTPAKCLVQWPGRDGWASGWHNVWLDGSFTYADVGRMFACQMFEYTGVHGPSGKEYTQHTAKQLTDVETGEKVPQARAQTNAPSAPPPPPPPPSAPALPVAAPPPPAPVAPPARSPVEKMRKDADERNTPSVQVRKRAVVIMHEDCLGIANKLLLDEGAGCADVINLARSLVVGMCTNAHAYEQYLTQAQAQIANERSEDAGMPRDTTISY